METWLGSTTLDGVKLLQWRSFKEEFTTEGSQNPHPKRSSSRSGSHPESKVEKERVQSTGGPLLSGSSTGNLTRCLVFLSPRRPDCLNSFVLQQCELSASYSHTALLDFARPKASTGSQASAHSVNAFLQLKASEILCMLSSSGHWAVRGGEVVVKGKGHEGLRPAPPSAEDSVYPGTGALISLPVNIRFLFHPDCSWTPHWQLENHKRQNNRFCKPESNQIKSLLNGCVSVSLVLSLHFITVSNKWRHISHWLNDAFQIGEGISPECAVQPKLLAKPRPGWKPSFTSSQRRRNK